MTKVGELGQDVGLKDREGNTIHVGDTLEFDEWEWGSPHSFVVGYERGELTGSGGFGDWEEWCTIVKKWDGSDVKVNVQKCLMAALGGTYGGPSISFEDGKWILYRWTDAPSSEEILVKHEDWTKFVWLCGDWAKENKAIS